MSSPCIRRCHIVDIDEESFCGGCYRTLVEISHWFEKSPEEKAEIIENSSRRKTLYSPKLRGKSGHT